PYFDEIAELPNDKATQRMQEIYLAPIQPDLVGQRVRELKEGGVIAAGSLTPQNVEQLAPVALGAGLDVLVIQGTVVSAEHVSSKGGVLDLKKYIAECEV